MSEMLHFIHRLAMNTFLCRNSALRTLCVREEEMSHNQDDSTRAKSAIFLVREKLRFVFTGTVYCNRLFVEYFLKKQH